MRTKKGFTLIELLVVISIIALLMSILLPALNSARLLAVQTVCNSRLRSVAQGMHVYSVDYKGYLPYCATWEANGPWQSHIVYNKATFITDKDGKSTDKYQPYNLAYLYESGIIDDPLQFYCPRFDKDMENGESIRGYFCYYTYLQGPNNKWGEYFEGQFVRTSYYYWPRNKKKVEKISNYGLVYDTIHNWESIPHCDLKGDPKGLTLAFGDGHVEFTTGNEIFDEELWNKGGPYNDGPGNHRDRFNEIARRMHGLTPMEFTESHKDWLNW